MTREIKQKVLIQTRLLKAYGSWIYCEGCNKTIGYLCYVTYSSFKLQYDCKCGNSGNMFLEFDDPHKGKRSDGELAVAKGRLCCPADGSPLVTILSGNLAHYSCQVTCKACGDIYHTQG